MFTNQEKKLLTFSRFSYIIDMYILFSIQEDHYEKATLYVACNLNGCISCSLFKQRQ